MALTPSDTSCTTHQTWYHRLVMLALWEAEVGESQILSHFGFGQLIKNARDDSQWKGASLIFSLSLSFPVCVCEDIKEAIKPEIFNFIYMWFLCQVGWGTTSWGHNHLSSGTFSVVDTFSRNLPCPDPFTSLLCCHYLIPSSHFSLLQTLFYLLLLWVIPRIKRECNCE